MARLRDRELGGLARAGGPARRAASHAIASARPALSSASHARSRWLPVGVLVAAGALAYSGSLTGPFVFDDLPQIVHAPESRELWPGLARFLQRQRTLTTASFALNHALGGLDPWGYHLFNRPRPGRPGCSLAVLHDAVQRLEALPPSKALAAASDAERPGYAARLALYRQGLPFRDTP